MAILTDICSLFYKTTKNSTKSNINDFAKFLHVISVTMLQVSYIFKQLWVLTFGANVPTK